MITKLWQQIHRDWVRASLENKLIALVALTLPLERLPTMKLGGLTMKLSMLFGVILIVLVVIQQWRTKQLRVQGRGEWLLLGFITWCVVSLVWVPDMSQAPILVVLLTYVVLLAMAIRRSLRASSLRLMVVALLAGAVGTCVFGLYQFIGDYSGLPALLTGMRPEYSWQHFGFPRVHSTLLEPLFLSAYLLLPIAIVLTYILRGTRYARLLFGLLGLFVGADILTLSRGGLIALGLLIALSIGLTRQRRTRSVPRRQVLSLAGVLVVGAGLSLALVGMLNRKGTDTDVTYGSQGLTTWWQHLSNTKITPDATNTANRDSVYDRDQSRRRASADLMSSPSRLLFGYGPGQYRVAATAAMGGITAANVLVIDIVLYHGLVGLGLVAGAVITIVWQALRRLRTASPLAVAVLAYLGAISVQSFTFSSLFITHLWFAIGVLWWLGAQSVRRAGNPRENTVS